MAQKRMIDKKVSVSEQVADLSILGQLVFTWSVPHSDDVGFLPHSNRSLKAMIIPMIEIELTEFAKIVNDIVKKGLWKEIEHEEDKFYYLCSFNEHQTLKKDRQPQTLLKFTKDKVPRKSWFLLGNILEQIGIQKEDNGFQMVSEVKGSEVNRKEVKIIEEKFEIFYKSYPRKVSKKKAGESYKRIMLKCNEGGRFKLAGSIMIGLEIAKKSDQWTKDDGKFSPHPTTWLNQERWTDEVETTTKKEIKKL